MILYVDAGYTSPYAMSVYVTLVEKDLQFELKLVDLEVGENKHGPYRDLGLTGRVPALVDGDLVLTESSAIIEYLEEQYPAPAHAAVLPQDRVARAKAREVQAWIRSDNMPIRTERNTGVIFTAPISTPLSADGQAAAERLFRIAGRLVSGPNLFGQWSIADTDLALMLNRLVMNGDPVPQALKDYASAQWQRRSVQQWMALPRG
jgi:glutathione S-transferase